MSHLQEAGRLKRPSYRPRRKRIALAAAATCLAGFFLGDVAINLLSLLSLALVFTSSASTISLLGSVGLGLLFLDLVVAFVTLAEFLDNCRRPFRRRPVSK
jgi:hypothetical protein